MKETPIDVTVEQLLRELTPQVIGSVVRRFHDFSAAEDAVQEASLAAALQWPKEGLPDSPRAWLTKVALRKMSDSQRRESTRRRYEDQLASQTEFTQEHSSASDEDDTLVLLFMCCHPSLTQASAIALTLRAVGGLTTGEIAHAFLVPEPTMAQRISRAKQTIKNSGVSFQLPTNSERVQRLRAVLKVLYLIFNEGYTTSAGVELHRADIYVYLPRTYQGWRSEARSRRCTAARGFLPGPQGLLSRASRDERRAVVAAADEGNILR